MRTNLLLRVVAGTTLGALGTLGATVAARRVRDAVRARVGKNPDAPTEAPAEVWETPIDAVGTLGGWVDLPDGSQITALPLIDTRPEARAAGVWFARLRARDVPQALQRLGFDWAPESALRAAYATPGAIWIDPVTLWRSHADDARMSSREFAARHDELVRSRAAAAGRASDLGRSMLVNAGKVFLPGAPPGRAINWGWLRTRDPAGAVVQPAWKAGGSTTVPPHNDAHVDYSQVVYGYRAPPRSVSGAEILRQMVGD